MTYNLSNRCEIVRFYNLYIMPSTHISPLAEMDRYDRGIGMIWILPYNLLNRCDVVSHHALYQPSTHISPLADMVNLG